MRAEAVAHFLLSVIATAVIAGLVTVVGEIAGEQMQFFITWLVCFCVWWGIWYIGEC